MAHNSRVAHEPEARSKNNTSQFGPFVLERRLAVGGSAEVFLAHPASGALPAPRLVVKRLLPELRETDSFSLLEHEARLHQAVVHDNVVRIFGAGMVGDEPYLAMEYVDGVDVYGLLRRAESEQRRVPPRLAIFIARAIAKALGSVHSATDAEGNPLHIVHRDVTPSNIYLSSQGDVKLGDFGIARVTRVPRSSGQPTAGLKGKFGYLAPEQVAGEEFDYRADLFSLAVVLGELLVGRRIFPGNGQLAVLLAIRDVNIEPLRRQASSFPTGLMSILERALARDPNQRFASGEEFAAALESYETPSHATLLGMLSEWVNWARDSSQLAKQLEGRIRDSVQRMRAVKRLSPERSSEGTLDETLIVANTGTSKVLRTNGQQDNDVGLPALIEMIATGELAGDDKVALMGADFEEIRHIEDLARHLLPSTTATTNRLFEPGIPDYQALLKDTSMLKVLARMRQGSETGALFVHRRDADQHPVRKEIYLRDGRLFHVASSEREELLGEYLVRRGRITREQLNTALTLLASYGGHLGDTLIGLELVDAMDVFRAIRDQGRDRVASLCGWEEGTVTFYRGTTPTWVQFPLDLDLASPMMAGTLVASHGDPKKLLPSMHHQLTPGPRAASCSLRKERGSAPLSLQWLPKLCENGLTIEGAIAKMLGKPESADRRRISEREAFAALVTAKHLGWVAFTR
jgi:serine/threonine-protein kinase